MLVAFMFYNIIHDRLVKKNLKRIPKNTEQLLIDIIIITKIKILIIKKMTKL